MANLGSLAESGVVALAVSEAAGAVVEPALEPARQEAEKATQARIHDLDQLAQSVAQALLGLEDVTDHAARNGYDKDELALSVQLALKAPGVPEALALYRRRDLTGSGTPPRKLASTTPSPKPKSSISIGRNSYKPPTFPSTRP